MRTLGLLPGSARAFGGFGRSGGGLFAKKAGNSASNGPVYDPSAQAFITAADITDPTQKSAINQLVLDLKSASLWTKMQALYPFVGGTAATHKWNLVNPVDSDVAFRGTFAGGVTHNANGITPNGSTGYMNTHLAGTQQTANSVHYSFYSRTATVTGVAFDLGAVTGGQGPQLICATSALGGVQVLADNTTVRANGTVADGLGLFTGSRTTNTSLAAYRNAASVGTIASVEPVPITSITDTYFIGARNTDGFGNSFSSRNCAFASFGLGLTAGDVTSLNTAVQAFQDTLGRQV